MPGREYLWNRYAVQRISAPLLLRPLIHVMQQRQIVESGSHGDILALGGHYTESWTTPMPIGLHPHAEAVPHVV